MYRNFLEQIQLLFSVAAGYQTSDTSFLAALAAFGQACHLKKRRGFSYKNLFEERRLESLGHIYTAIADFVCKKNDISMNKSCILIAEKMTSARTKFALKQ